MNIENLKKTVQAARTRRPTLVFKNANTVNVFTDEIIRADVALCGQTIIGIGSYNAPGEIDLEGKYLCPGFIDAHVHIESSMAPPSAFAGAVLPHGTTCVVADPHEIANVCGAEGIRFMLSDAQGSPLNIYFMLPSCVPATRFDHNAQTLAAEDLVPFMNDSRILGLGEVMDYSAVIQGDESMLKKLALFENRIIDGHAPQLWGSDLAAYRAAGPTTDHECASFEEILEKLRAGLKILLRVGSAANQMEEVFRKIAQSRLPTDNMMFCTDDKHIQNIRQTGHINAIAKMAVRAGIDPVSAVKMATINPYRTYGIPRRGAIAPGYIADLVVFDDLKDFRVSAVYTAGIEYRRPPDAVSFKAPESVLHSVHIAPLPKDPFRLCVKEKMPVIEMPAGQLLTRLTYEAVPSARGVFEPKQGYVKLAVLERHHALGTIGLGILKNFGLTNGAIASTVAHDSHNLIIAGDNDRDMLAAARALMDCEGGYVVVSGGKPLALLELPIAGLMSGCPVEQVMQKQMELLAAAASLGIPESSDPFIRLSFLALPNIPQVRITDMGVFDVVNSKFI